MADCVIHLFLAAFLSRLFVCTYFSFALHQFVFICVILGLFLMKGPSYRFIKVIKDFEQHHQPFSPVNGPLTRPFHSALTSGPGLLCSPFSTFLMINSVVDL